MQKRILTTMLSLALLIGSMAVPTPVAMAADKVDSTKLFDNIDYQMSSNIRVIIDGKQIVFDVNPQTVNGRTLVPMRTIFEAFGLTVTWDDTTKSAKGTSPDTTISFVIGSNKALVNNQEKILDVPASVIDGRTMIPLRFLSENMGYHVVWIGSSNLILISKSDVIEWRYEGYEVVPPYKEYERKYVNGVEAAETRYTGKNHEVKIVTLYSADGRLVPNVPDFKVASYGTGWFQQSPFVGKTYWVDIDSVSDTNNNGSFYDPTNFTAIKADVLRDSTPVGNYVKVRIDEQFFDLAAWGKMNPAPNSGIGSVQDTTLLDGKEISNSDAIFKVTVNDKYNGLIFVKTLIGPLLAPSEDKIYTIFEKDPRTIFDWSDNTWTRLKGENPWAGMTKDMLLVQKLNKPDIVTETKTRFTVYELWVYEYDYVDSVYFFDNDILTSIW